MHQSLSIFLVEDETLIRMMMVDLLDELGHKVVVEADNVADASAFATTAEFDLAVLDINLKGSYVNPVADLLELRHKPFLFVSGYGRELLPTHFKHRLILRKPVSPSELRLAIASAAPA